MFSLVRFFNICIFVNVLIIEWHKAYSGPNDCTKCASGSSGSCAPDVVDCVTTIPWHSNYCGDDHMIQAGENGCENCKEVRSICATTCNWCTPGGTWPTTTTTTKEPTTKNTQNDCSTCATGSPGSFCEHDTIDCQGLPWGRKEICQSKSMVDVGKEGCQTCSELYANGKNLASICATTCNWCTLAEPIPITTPASITTSPLKKNTEKMSKGSSHPVTLTSIDIDKHDGTSKISPGNEDETTTIVESDNVATDANEDGRKDSNVETIIGVVLGLTFSAILILIALFFVIRNNKTKDDHKTLDEKTSKPNFIKNESDRASVSSFNHDDVYENTKNPAFQNPYYEGDLEVINNTKANNQSNVDLNDIEIVTAKENIYYQI